MIPRKVEVMAISEEAVVSRDFKLGIWPGGGGAEGSAANPTGSS